jgi:sensor histidine kinase YesM
MVIRGIFILSVILVCRIGVTGASPYWLSGQNKDTAALNLLIRKAFKSFKEPSGLQNAKKLIDSAEAVCRDLKTGFPPMLNLARAEYFMLTKDYGNASKEATITLQLARTYRDRNAEAKAYTFFGSYYLNTGFFRESILNYENSIRIAEKYGLKGVIPAAYQGIAAVYSALKEYPDYKDMLEKAINAASEEKDTSVLLLSYFRLGSMYSEADRHFSLADSVLRKCSQIASAKGDSVYNGLAWANLGWNFYLEKRYDKAIHSYNKSLEYSIPIKRFSTSANSYGNLGTINRDLRNFQKALDYYNKGIEQAKLANDIYVISWIYRDMSDLFLVKKDTSNAYKNYVLFKKYNDIYLQGDKVKGMNDAAARFQAESQSKEVELLSLQLRNQRLVIFGSSAFFVLMMLILLLIYSRARINAKRRITEMDRQISELNQANLRQQMNPHSIFNTLNSIQYYMYQHDKLATNNYLTKFSNLIRKVLENSRYTSIPIRDELDALRLYLDLEMLRFKEKFDYSINVDEEIDTIMYKIPTMLIQPYVENSLTHGLIPSGRKGFIKIDLNLKNDYISCTIEDNGIGRKAAEMYKGLNGNEHSSLGTKITTSRLDLVNALCGTCLKTIYTDLHNEKGDAAGTRVEIHIPVMS